MVIHPILQAKLASLRDRESGTGTFRGAMSDLASLMLFEVTRDLECEEFQLVTPLGVSMGSRPRREVILAPILRAGLGLLEGMQKLLPEAAVAHIGVSRDEETRRPRAYYCSVPEGIGDAVVLVLDPMLATGGSACHAIQQLKERGARWVRFVCVVSCRQGIERVRREHPDVPVFTAAIDPELNGDAYIVPGLGDAGDRYFGTH